jgi:hypothetical protein
MNFEEFQIRFNKLILKVVKISHLDNKLANSGGNFSLTLKIKKILIQVVYSLNLTIIKGNSQFLLSRIKDRFFKDFSIFFRIICTIIYRSEFSFIVKRGFLL